MRQVVPPYHPPPGFSIIDHVSIESLGGIASRTPCSVSKKKGTLHFFIFLFYSPGFPVEGKVLLLLLAISMWELRTSRSLAPPLKPICLGRPYKELL